MVKSSNTSINSSEETIYYLTSDDVNIQKWINKKIWWGIVGAVFAFVPILTLVLSEDYALEKLLTSVPGFFISIVSGLDFLKGISKTWHLRMDAEGIELEFSGQNPIYMKWHDINDIHVSKDIITLYSGTKKMELKANMLGNKWKEVKKRVESKPMVPLQTINVSTERDRQTLLLTTAIMGLLITAPFLVILALCRILVFKFTLLFSLQVLLIFMVSLFLSSLVLSIFPRGEWTLNEQGILFQPMDKTPIFLRWEDIHEVTRGLVTITLSGNEKKIKISLLLLTRYEQKIIKNFIFKKTGFEPLSIKDKII